MQQTILNAYQKQFPSQTFQNISKQTGIQVTRIFRIFNGSEMKLGEYITFKSIIDQKRGADQKFQELFDHALMTLPNESLRELRSSLEKKKRIYQLKERSQTVYKAA